MNATRPLKKLRDDPKVVRKIVAEATKLAKAEKRAVTGEDMRQAKAKILPPVARPAGKKDRRKRHFHVMVTGTDLVKCQELGQTRGVAEITSDEEALDLDVTDLESLFKKLAKLVVKHGQLKVSLAFYKEQRGKEAA